MYKTKKFAANEHVSTRINEAEPENLIIRAGKIELPQTLLNKTQTNQCLTTHEQWNFQAKFFKQKIKCCLVN